MDEQRHATHPDRLKDVPWFVAAMFLLIAIGAFGVYEFHDWQWTNSKPRSLSFRVVAEKVEPKKP